MPTCNICIDTLKEPVSLPCGHVFCAACIVRAVNTIKPPTTIQPCPTCRTMYSIVHVDPSMVPHSIRPHVVPSIRRLYLEEANTQSSPSPPAAVSECGRLAAENGTLRANCDIWKRRAELHAAATIGLLNFARVARACTEQLKHEKDELRRQCTLLKRKLEVEESFSFSASASASASSSIMTSDKWDHVSNLAPDLFPNPGGLSSEDAALLPSAYAPCPVGQFSVPTRATSSAPVGSRQGATISMIPPPEQNLPPSLKRRKTSDSNKSSESESEPEQRIAPRRSLRKRKAVVS
ncbi:hypothetical protein BT96DRAFT_61251 [Gymnopus androsaceus JB14]|uniref:RING-type E3 ubiquitin transferase n=1 Tax=Gymnopus androsaceus JB14 TaxID=1447944 RepID=A0A6A4HIH8_9AGAR|nr:hypothetical protein BT96DRAFT_61251 [Gymnopus androsaceus JB14]